MWTKKFQTFKLGLEKAEEPEIKLPTFTGSKRKEGIPGKKKKKKKSASVSLTTTITTPKMPTLYTQTYFGRSSAICQSGPLYL